MHFLDRGAVLQAAADIGLVRGHHEKKSGGLQGLKETITAQTRECIGIFEQALVKYYARDWDTALALFAQSRELEFNVPGKTPGVSSNPSLVYLDITAHYQHEPPAENWDGVYVMKEK